MLIRVQDVRAHTADAESRYAHIGYRCGVALRRSVDTTQLLHAPGQRSKRSTGEVWAFRDERITSGGSGTPLWQRGTLP